VSAKNRLKPAASFLVKRALFEYRHAMLRPPHFVFCALVCASPLAFADTLQLKDNSAITGKVLAEKRDAVAVDVGYTVLVVPRANIAKISRDEDAEPVIKPSPAPKPAGKS